MQTHAIIKFHVETVQRNKRQFICLCIIWFSDMFTVQSSPISSPPTVAPESPQPSSSTAQLQDTPRKRKLRTEVGKLRTRVHRLKRKLITGTSPRQRKRQKLAQANMIVTQLEQYLPKTTVDLIRGQVIRPERMKPRVRWSLQDNMLALSIFYHSRKAYTIIGKIFAMPSKRTLQRALQKCDVVPGFSEQLFDALKVKVQSMSEQDRQCDVVLYDQIFGRDSGETILS